MSVPVSADTTEPGGAFVPLGQDLAVDTRNDIGLTTVDEQPRSFQLGGQFGVPTSGVEAVVLNTIVTNATDAGGLRFGPTVDQLSGNGFFHSYMPDNATSNQSIVRMSSSGGVAIAASRGSIDVVVRVVGYFTESGTGSGLHAVNPVRLLDTHTGTGGVSTPVQPGTSVTVSLPDWVSVEANAAWVNVTAFGADGNGWLSLKPVGSTSQGTRASFDGGMPKATGVITQVSNRQFSILNNGNTAVDVTLDLQGYFLPGSREGLFNPRVATLLDTHLAAAVEGPLAPGQVITLWPLGSNGLPVDNISALSLNLTVFNPAADGKIRVWPTGLPEPNIATMAFDSQERTTNSVLVNIGDPDASRGIEIRNDSAATIDIGVNTEGWFTAYDDAFDDLNGIQPMLDAMHACMVNTGQVPASSTTAETLGTYTDGGQTLPPTGSEVTPSDGCINEGMDSVSDVYATEGLTIPEVQTELAEVSNTAQSDPSLFAPLPGPTIVANSDEDPFQDVGPVEESGDDAPLLERWTQLSDPGSYMYADESSDALTAADVITFGDRFKKMQNRSHIVTLPYFMDHRFRPSYLNWGTDHCSGPVGDGAYKHTNPCIRHDFGYRNLKTAEFVHDRNVWRRVNKAAVDTRFGADLANHCERNYNGVKEGLCRAEGEAFEWAVREYGKPWETHGLTRWRYHSAPPR